jgi:hypothetical protein
MRHERSSRWIIVASAVLSIVGLPGKTHAQDNPNRPLKNRSAEWPATSE